MFKVYEIKFDNGKSYIGYTKMKLELRLWYHKRDARRGSMLPVHCAIRKYPEQYKINLTKSFDTKKEALAFEILSIKNGTNLYNLSDGGECFPEWATGNYWKEGKTKEEISEINKKKGRPGSQNPFYGRKHSKESMEKMVRTRRERGSFPQESAPNRRKGLSSEDYFVFDKDGNKLIKVTPAHKPVVYKGEMFSSKTKLREYLGIGRIRMETLIKKGEITDAADV